MICQRSPPAHVDIFRCTPQWIGDRLVFFLGQGSSADRGCEVINRIEPLKSLTTWTGQQ
jgi:hypothetical protein